MVSLTYSHCLSEIPEFRILISNNRSKYTWSTEKGHECTADQKKIILAETAIAHEIATHLETNFRAQSDKYLDAFFPTSPARGQPRNKKYIAAIKSVYHNVADIASQKPTSGYIVDVTCASSTRGCEKGNFLHMNDILSGSKGKTVATMNFCPGDKKFFNTLTTGEESLIDTNKRLNELKAQIKGDKSNFLKLAHRSRAIALIHELSHTNYATAAAVDQVKTPYDRYHMAKDFAYGLGDCLALAKGTFMRAPGSQRYVFPSGSVYCGESNDKGGICPAAVAFINADSYAFLAAGVWFSKQLGKEIPVPSCTATSKRFGSLDVRAPACGVETVDVFDLPTDQGAKVAAA